MKTADYILLGALAAAAYWLYKKLPNVTAPIVNPVADAYAAASYYATNLNTGEQSQLTGMVILPDGSTVAMTSLTVKPIAGSNGAYFSWQGSTYYLCSPSDSNGNWTAQTSSC